MNKVKVKIPAKLNLSLDVLGQKDNYHELNSFVCSINLYDEITVKKRKDGAVTLTEKGIKSNCEIPKNNAYKSAKLFVEEFSTLGVDIVLNKKIPVGNGLGGSSADIAGTLIAMQKLFGIEKDVKPLADKLGSDASYMLRGGYAKISGRGEKVTYFDFNNKLYFLILTQNQMISAKDCYNKFDEIKISNQPCTQKSIKAFAKNDYSDFIKAIKNDLYFPAKEILPSIEENINLLYSVGADKAILTGSGSAVYGIFKDKKARNTAYKKLKNKYDGLIKAETL